jgi:F-type H+-transporting ATPase subunit epsilon
MMLKLTVLSADRRILENVSVSEVTLTGSEGQIQVLPGHQKMVGNLEPGLFEYQSGENTDFGFISYGFFQVDGEHVTVTAEAVELTSEINSERAKMALDKSENHLKTATLSEAERTKYARKLERARLRVAMSERAKNTTH